jgi:hypothetical protein
VGRYIVVPSPNKCCHGYAVLPSLFIVGVDAAVGKIKVFSVKKEMQKIISLPRCPAAKYSYFC